MSKWAPVKLRASGELAWPGGSKTGAPRRRLIACAMTAGECVISSDDLRQSRLVLHVFAIIFQGCRRCCVEG